MSKRDYEISNQEMSNFYNDIFSKINCEFKIKDVISYQRKFVVWLIVFAFAFYLAVITFFIVPLFNNYKLFLIVLLVFAALIVRLFYLGKKFRELNKSYLNRLTYLNKLKEINNYILKKPSRPFDETIQGLMKELEIASSLDHRRTNFFVGILLASFTVIITSITALNDGDIKNILAGVHIVLSIATLLITVMIFGIQKDVPFLGKQYKYSKIRNILNDIVYYYG
ncbi:hypothetical protein ACVR1G_09245 [Streptococcus dentasini]